MRCVGLSPGLYQREDGVSTGVGSQTLSADQALLL